MKKAFLTELTTACHVLACGSPYMNLSQELIKQGWCWWYQKYAPGDTVLEGLETKFVTL